MRSCDTSIAHRAPRLTGGLLRGNFPRMSLLLSAVLLAGCSPGNSTRLPELSSIPRRLLSAEEQKKAVDALQERRETHREEAIEEIKSAKARSPAQR